MILLLPAVAGVLTGCGADAQAEAAVPPPITDCNSAYDCALRTELPPTATIHVAAGDRLTMETPGGGGWGERLS